MSKLSFYKTPLAGLYEIEPTVYGDKRGYFMETFNHEFAPYVKHLDGTPATFVQDNESKSRRGVLRGLHMQVNNPQGKLLRVISGEIYDVAVDLRKDSPTYAQYHGTILSAENKKQFYIPEGFAHGFLVLSKTSILVYKCTRPYDSTDELGLLWNDPDIGIDWPIGQMTIITSERDKNNPSLKDVQSKFLINP